jgi:DNA polymerase-3 subunit epsilon
MERLIILDTETTGIEPSEGHRIIEIGCCEVLNRKITDSEYHQYIQPERTVGDSMRIHGLTDKFLVEKPKFSEIVNDFLNYIDGTTLVIHNAPFDLGFLNHELQLMGIQKTIESRCQIIDSLELSKQQRPGTLHNLDALCRRFEVDASSRTKHGALLDAQILAQVYLAMTGGQFNLFNDDSPINQQQNKIITKAKANRKPIKIIRANAEENNAHQTYFETL